MFDYVTTSDYIEINDAQIPVDNVTLSKSAYNPKTGNLIGTAMAKVLIFEMDNSTVVEGQSFIYHAVTVNSEGDGEDYNIGSFIAVDVAVGDTEGITKVTAMDIMLRANKAYSTSLNYSSGMITLNDVLGEICADTGITLSESTLLINGNFIVDKNHFINGETYREAIAAIAEANGAFAQIVNDKLVFITPDMNADAVAEAIPEEYDTLTVQETTDPINKVVIRDTVSGEETSLGSDGGTLYINDNQFAYNEMSRSALIANIYNTLLGFTYYVYTAKGLGDPGLNCGDRIRVYDSNRNEYDSFMFFMEYKSTSGSKSKNSVTSAPAVVKTEVSFQYIENDEMKAVKKAMAYTSQVGQAVTAAETLLAAPGNSYVRFSPSISNPSEIYVMNTEDTVTATNVMRFNSAGWGISTNGINGPYNIAATAEGIVADYITTGNLSADLITSGTLSANLIFAGTLNAASGTFTSLTAGLVNGQRLAAGYDSNNEPFIKMYDNNNTLVWTWDKTGISIGTTTKIAPYAIGAKYGMGVFVG